LGPEAEEKMADDFDLTDIVGDSNAGAYQKTESRTGPPLDYVSEKMGRALDQLHYVVGALRKGLPDPETSERLALSVQGAFRLELVAFLALHNLLGLANKAELFEELLGLSQENFEEWLAQMRGEGSVTG